MQCSSYTQSHPFQDGFFCLSPIWFHSEPDYSHHGHEFQHSIGFIQSKSMSSVLIMFFRDCLSSWKLHGNRLSHYGREEDFPFWIDTVSFFPGEVLWAILKRDMELLYSLFLEIVNDGIIHLPLYMDELLWNGSGLCGYWIWSETSADVMAEYDSQPMISHR